MNSVGMYRFAAGVGMLCLMLAAASARAGGLLTEAHIHAYIDSLADIQELADSYRGEDLSLDNLGAGESLNAMQRIVRQLRGHPMHARFAETVDYHGFSSPEHWAEVADAILVAYIAVEMDRHQPGMREGMARQGMAELARVPDRNMALVEAHTEALRDAFEGRR